MKHADHINLLRPAHLPAGGQWADLGAGAGAFTLALRELVGAETEIYAVDADRASLDELARSYLRRFKTTGRLHCVQADFTRPLDLPLLDGLLMANSLHFHRDKERLLQHVATFLKPGGIFLLVEYNVDKGNPWVPYPLSFETFRRVAQGAGWGEPRLLARHPSNFLREFYSAAAVRPASLTAPSRLGGGASHKLTVDT